MQSHYDILKKLPVTLSKPTVKYLLDSKKDIPLLEKVFTPNEDSKKVQSEITCYVSAFTLADNTNIQTQVNKFRETYRQVDSALASIELFIEPLKEFDIKTQIQLLAIIFLKADISAIDMLSTDKNLEKIIEDCKKSYDALQLDKVFRITDPVTRQRTHKTVTQIITQYIQCKIHDMLPEYVKFKTITFQHDQLEKINQQKSINNYLSINKKNLVTNKIKNLEKNVFYSKVKAGSMFALLMAFIITLDYLQKNHLKDPSYKSNFLDFAALGAVLCFLKIVGPITKQEFQAKGRLSFLNENKDKLFPPEAENKSEMTQQKRLN